MTPESEAGAPWLPLNCISHENVGLQPDPRAIDDPTAEHPFMHKTLQTRGMSHCGVSIGVYGQDGAIIRVNADEMAWPKAQCSCTIPVPRQLPKEGNTATTIKPVCAYAWR